MHCRTTAGLVALVTLFWTGCVGDDDSNSSEVGQATDAGGDVTRTDGSGSSDAGQGDSVGSRDSSTTDTDTAEPAGLPALPALLECTQTMGRLDFTGPTIPAQLLVEGDPDTGLTVSSASASGLGGCLVTFDPEADGGQLASAEQCTPQTGRGPWQDGTLSTTAGTLALEVSRELASEIGGGTEVFTFSCGFTPIEVYHEVTVVIAEGGALVEWAAPDHAPDQAPELATSCEDATCTLPIPDGWTVRLFSSHPVGPVEWSATPAEGFDCFDAGAGTLSCGAVISDDLRIEIVWPPYEEPPPTPYNLTVHTNGYSTGFSYERLGEVVSGGCSSDCVFEVDAGSSVGATVSSADPLIDISGTTHSCQIVNSRSWTCQFPMNDHRTFTVYNR